MNDLDLRLREFDVFSTSNQDCAMLFNVLHREEGLEISLVLERYPLPSLSLSLLSPRTSMQAHAIANLNMVKLLAHQVINTFVTGVTQVFDQRRKSMVDMVAPLKAS